MKLTDALKGYWLDKQLNFSPASIETYSWVLNHFSEFVGDVEIEAITSNDVRRFLVHLRTERNLSKRSVHDHWARLSSLWTWAEVELKIEHVIKGKVKRPAYPKTLIDPFTAQDVHLMVIAAEWQKEYVKGRKAVKAKHPTGERDRAIVLLLADTGLRASELCDLTIKDYDEKRGRLHVRHGKGDKQRHVILGVRSRKAIWKYLASRTAAQEKDPLFITREGKPIDRFGVHNLVERIGKQAGVENAHPHRFRHFFAITFLRNGGNIYLLKELLGHETLQMTMHYAKLAEQDIDKAGVHSPVDNLKI
jgi:integrase/recombinase XerD